MSKTGQSAHFTFDFIVMSLKTIYFTTCEKFLINFIYDSLLFRDVFVRNNSFLFARKSLCLNLNLFSLLRSVGGLVLAAFDQVPWELHDNSIILGCLSFFVALVMLYDLADPIARQVTDTTQTDTEYTVSQQQQQQQQPQQQQSSQQPQQPQQQIGAASDVAQVNPSTSNQTIQSNQSNHFNQFNLPASSQPSEMQRNDVTDKPIQVTEPVVEKVVTQTQSIQTAVDPTMLNDIAQNGYYHRGDTIDFVQYQHMPQPQQPVFERVLLPEKKRPTYNKVADPHKATIIQNVRTNEYVPRETHFDETMNYSQMPKYAAVQRQQHHQQPNYQHQQQQHQTTSSHPNYSTSYAPPSPMYKLSRNYEHNDFERPPIKQTIINDYGRSAPKPTIKTIYRSDELSRYHDTSIEHQNQPMMVIRKYGHSTPTTRPSKSTSQSISELRHHHSNDSVYHRNGNNNGTHITQINARKNGCRGPNTDDEVDFRKCSERIRLACQ